jgi:hypothetical protein
MIIKQLPGMMLLNILPATDLSCTSLKKCGCDKHILAKNPEKMLAIISRFSIQKIMRRSKGSFCTD